MPGRSYTSSSNYRFGFNGQEKDDEVCGSGNLNTAEFWEYDTRLGRRWNLDPKPKVGLSDYSAFGDNPIFNKDPDGAYFFGLIGSTSEQRRTARDFAAATGGTINNITSKNVNVTYQSPLRTVCNEETEQQAVVISPDKTMHFQTGGGLDYGKGWGYNAEKRAQYESSLSKGGWINGSYQQPDYDIYTGYSWGSGALASPTIDPIDIFAGMIAGGLLSSGAKTAAVEGTEATAGKEVADFSKGAIRNMNNPDRAVPVSLLDDVAKNTKGFPDPQGSAASMHYSTMLKNGKAYNLEVLYNESNNTILHFKYTPKAIGPLPAIK